MNSKSSILPDGRRFDFWEKEVNYTKELYVDCMGENASDTNPGTKEAPFKTIQAAANVATPGTHVWIAPGEYRECVRPKQGGTSAEEMICYEAIEKGTVYIKASEEVTAFEKSTDWRMYGFEDEPSDKDPVIYCHKLDPDMFRGYNPFCAVNILHDRLFIEYEKTDMTTYLNRRGMVFCDGKMLKQVALYNMISKEEGTYWVEANGQTIHFRLPGDDDPANHRIEISCREQCFAPDIPFLNYIKIKGLVCSHASMGAPVPQRGSISAYRGHHWVIEDCTVDWANTLAIDVGNECWHHDPTTSELIGYSVIRRCHIIDAGVCGIAGLFSEKMLVEDNLIEGTGWQKMELSWEAGGMKLHNSVDGLFRRNVFKNTFRADHIWLDCGNVNNRITQNLFLDGIEQREAIFIECTRNGINLIDHNIFWNIEGRFDPAKIPAEPGSTGWYKMVEHDAVNGYAVYGEGTDRMQLKHNFIGKVRGSGYYAKPVSFRITQNMRGGTSRDAEFFNNIFYDCGEAAITMPTEKNTSDGNVFMKMHNGGYLRIMYPAPEVCLDLASWQEFYGFDTNGQEAWFEFDIDTDKMEMVVSTGKTKPWLYGPDAQTRHFAYTPEEIKKVDAVQTSDADYFLEDVDGETVLPGPFKTIEVGKVYKLDPRIME